MTRSEAREAGKSRYVGRICERHPDAGGVRYVSNCTCICCDHASSSASSKKYKAKRQAWRREHRETNREALRAKDKERQTNPVTRPQYLEYQRWYTTERRSKESERERNAIRRQCPEYNKKQIDLKRAWRDKNRDAHREATREYENKKRREDIQWRLAKNLRHRLRKAVRGETKGGSAVRDLGMSISDFKEYLESLFDEGMTWGNYGEWHIDHRRPLSSFDLTQPDDVRAACHYSNLQPLWAFDNQSKHAKVETE